jgi:hypothetical protein
MQTSTHFNKSNQKSFLENHAVKIPAQPKQIHINSA